MYYYAVTINNQKLVNKFRTIDSVYKHFQYMPITINVIAVERNELNSNIHYHLLISAEVPITFSVDNEFIWQKELLTELDIVKYQEYIKKDGKYKIYHAIPLAINSGTTKYDNMLRDCYSYNNFLEMIKDNPQYIRDIHRLEALWKLVKRNQ